MSKRTKEIRIMVTENEHKIISENAQKQKMQVSPYIRKVAQNPIVTQVDYSIISEHTKEIAEVRNAINRIAFTIAATNSYLPKEMKSIVEMMNGIFESENKLLRAIRKDHTKQYEKALNEAEKRKMKHFEE